MPVIEIILSFALCRAALQHEMPRTFINWNHILYPLLLHAGSFLLTAAAAAIVFNFKLAINQCCVAWAIVIFITL